MGRYDDVIDFLAKHEDKKEGQMNRRETLSGDDLSALHSQHSGIPDDYIDYLAEVGYGAFRECQYAVYGGFIEPSFIFGDDRAALLDKRILLFGDNFCGDPAGFVPDEDWAVVEIWHDSMQIYETDMTFESFIREQMLMDETGNDLRED